MALSIRILSVCAGGNHLTVEIGEFEDGTVRVDDFRVLGTADEKLHIEIIAFL